VCGGGVCVWTGGGRNGALIDDREGLATVETVGGGGGRRGWRGPGGGTGDSRCGRGVCGGGEG